MLLSALSLLTYSRYFIGIKERNMRSSALLDTSNAFCSYVSWSAFFCTEINRSMSVTSYGVILEVA